jgi:hypothetical protein
MNPEVIKSPSGLRRSSWNISMDFFFWVLFSLGESVRTNHFGSESTSPDFIPWLARSRRARGPMFYSALTAPPTARPSIWLGRASMIWFITFTFILIISRENLRLGQFFRNLHYPAAPTMMTSQLLNDIIARAKTLFLPFACCYLPLLHLVRNAI